MWTVIAAFFIGIVVGGLARLLLPGKQNISIGATIFIGFLAAAIGGLVAQAFGLGEDGFSFLRLLIQVGFGMVGIGFWSGWFFKR
ncbi:MAG: GlsB/YeaQ/YmgE family stress response membrane protein [Acidimicrobiia bacterium]